MIYMSIIAVKGDRLTRELFYGSMKMMSSDKYRIEYMLRVQSAGYQFDMDERPEELFHYFCNSSSSGYGSAINVAKAFQQCFPAPIFCLSLSTSVGQPTTLIEYIDWLIDSIINTNVDPIVHARAISLQEAFHAIGLRTAEQYDRDSEPITADDLVEYYLDFIARPDIHRRIRNVNDRFHATFEHRPVGHSELYFWPFAQWGSNVRYRYDMSRGSSYRGMQSIRST